MSDDRKIFVLVCALAFITLVVFVIAFVSCSSSASVEIVRSGYGLAC